MKSKTQISVPSRPKHRSPTFDGPFCFFYSGNHNQCPIPLLKTRYEVKIKNNFAQIRTTQLYSNPFSKQIEILYSIPTDINFCVSRLNIYHQKYTLQGVVKELQKTELQYAESKTKGDTVLISSYSNQDYCSLRANIGVLEAKQSVKIQYDMIGQLKQQIVGQWTLLIPQNISPRYLNDLNILESKFQDFLSLQVQYSQYIEVHPKFQAKKEFKITLECSQPIIDWSTTSCQLKAIPLSSRQFQFQLLSHQITQRHFKFTYAYHFREFIFTAGKQCLFISFNPIQKQSNFDNYKAEYIFFIDRSGSMKGSRIQKAKKALILFLKSLPESSRYNIVSFGSHFEKMYQKSTIYSDKHLATTIHQIEKFQADFGGTEIAQPLLDIIAKNKKMMTKFERNIIILTDGYPQNTQKVIHLISQMRQQNIAHVHMLGIGGSVSYDLIKQGALQGNGQYFFIKKQEQISKSVIKLLQRIVSNKLQNFQINCENKFVQETRIPQMVRKGYIHQIILRRKEIDSKQSKSRGKQKIQIRYFDGENNNYYNYISEIRSDQAYIEGLDKYLIHKQIKQLGFFKQGGTKMNIIGLSLSHQVISNDTCLVCTIKNNHKNQKNQKESFDKINRIVGRRCFFKAKKIRISIQAIKNTTQKETLLIFLQMKVGQLKKAVAKLMEIPFDKIRLFYMHNQLKQDQKALSTYRIIPDCTVYLAVKEDDQGEGFYVHIFQNHQVYISCPKQINKQVKQMYGQIAKHYPELQGLQYNFIYNKKTIDPTKLIREQINLESQQTKVYTNIPKYIFSYVQLVKLMKVSGYWQYEDKILKNLKIDKDVLDLLKITEKRYYNIIMTEAILKYLKSRFPQAQNELKLIYSKVQRFLRR